MAVCTNGCLTTQHVWEDGAYHPAAEPRLRLAACEQKGDVLVQYDECFDDSKTIKPRAYWLLIYQTAITNISTTTPMPRPEFVKSARSLHLSPVPQINSEQDVSTNGYCVQANPDKRSFLLWHNGVLRGKYRLPSYSGMPPTTAGRLALTPLAVAADAAIDTFVVFAVAFVVAGEPTCNR